ncbi:MAG: hypothetical protein GX568_06920 [Candidatus Gastranaerophilales bacterium]|jgi:hypothetical protein|nr:hypothetical protein [Candidatus Gastranaerophilales bacterium]
MISCLGFKSHVNITDRRIHNKKITQQTEFSVHTNFVQAAPRLIEHPENAEPGDILVTKEEGGEKRNVIIITAKDRKGKLAGFFPTETDRQYRLLKEKDFKNVIEAYNQHFNVQI